MPAIPLSEWTGPQMGDAAFAQDLNGTSFKAVAGYLQAPNALHAWQETDWDLFPGHKLPIWVGAFDGIGEAQSAVTQLKGLKVPAGSVMALDLEGRVDRSYVDRFFTVIHLQGYKLWVYGSADTLFGNPSCNGYWVADYAGIGPFMYNHPKARATQYENGSLYDSSSVMEWCLRDFWI